MFEVCNKMSSVYTFNSWISNIRCNHMSISHKVAPLGSISSILGLVGSTHKGTSTKHDHHRTQWGKEEGLGNGLL